MAATSIPICFRMSVPFDLVAIRFVTLCVLPTRDIRPALQSAAALSVSIR
jgi:hypothetical protein